MTDATYEKGVPFRLEELVTNWQVPVEDISILGYSMGGLVARSALYYGAEAQHNWVKYAHKLMFVGTPHHGSMVEQAGNVIDLALEVSLRRSLKRKNIAVYELA